MSHIQNLNSWFTSQTCCSSGLSQFCKWYHHLLKCLKIFTGILSFFPLSLLCLIHWHGMFLPNTSKPELLHYQCHYYHPGSGNPSPLIYSTVISALNVLLLLCPLLSTPHANNEIWKIFEGNHISLF